MQNKFNFFCLGCPQPPEGVRPAGTRSQLFSNPHQPITLQKCICFTCETSTIVCHFKYMNKLQNVFTVNRDFWAKVFPTEKNHLFLKQLPNAPTSIKPAIQLGPYFHPFFMKQITFSTQDIFVKVISLYCIKGQGFCMFSTVGTRTVHRGGNVRRHPWWWNDGNPGPRRPAPLPLHRCTGALHIICGYQQMQKSVLASAQLVHTCSACRGHSQGCSGARWPKVSFRFTWCSSFRLSYFAVLGSLICWHICPEPLLRLLECSWPRFNPGHGRLTQTEYAFDLTDWASILLFSSVCI